MVTACRATADSGIALRWTETLLAGVRANLADAEDVIMATGASLLYLPPYSPDLNRIEQVFAKLNALLRGAAARTKEALWTTIGQLLDRLKPAECGNYLTNSGYEFT